MRKVVVTGMGSVASSGLGSEKLWSHVVNGKSFAKKNQCFDTSLFKSKVCAPVELSQEEINYCLSIVSNKEKRRMDDFIYYGVIASSLALQDSEITSIVSNNNRCAVLVGSGIGGIKAIQSNVREMQTKGPLRISPVFLPSILINLLPGHIAIKFNIKGPNFSHVSACATSAHAIGEAYRMISENVVDIAVAGGSEAAICEIGIGGFDAMGALSTNYNNDPARASRPLDKNRDGFVMSDGAAVLILEEYEHAKARGAKIYAEIVGYGLSCDAGHITAPDINGDGALRAMQMATKNIKQEQVDYINLHGTSTPVGDLVELNAIKALFPNYGNIAISSTKSVTGHLLGASGGIEAIVAIKAINNNIIPGHINLDNPEDLCSEFNIITNSVSKDVNYVLSNSFGFGGTNCSLLFKKVS
jgi:3-oxoacyl-[acyl-carrier-protein] synthase II